MKMKIPSVVEKVLQREREREREIPKTTRVDK